MREPRMLLLNMTATMTLLLSWLLSDFVYCYFSDKDENCVKQCVAKHCKLLVVWA